MDILNDVARQVSVAGKAVVEKATDMKDTAKINMEIRSKEDFIQRQLAEIGRLVYEQEKDKDSTEYEEVFLIKRTYEEIDELKDDLAIIKGSTKCSSCGKEVSAGSTFCPHCGEKIDKED
ncbi:MAG: zinc ribbon domain-containing protein [Eubacterium sp.]|nr:zinc ribbon domain-containing protein [Eubacterium sp.]